MVGILSEQVEKRCIISKAQSSTIAQGEGEGEQRPKVSPEVNPRCTWTWRERVHSASAHDDAKIRDSCGGATQLS